MCNPITTRRPDCLLAKGEHSGIEWEIVHNGMGYRCGYVRIPLGHPWHGLGYNDVPAEVHGGLTFAEHDANCGKGGSDDAWWLGFDCAHYMDAPDPSLPFERVHSLAEVSVALRDVLEGVDAAQEIRDTAYVQHECESLCEQAAAAA